MLTFNNVRRLAMGTVFLSMTLLLTTGCSRTGRVKGMITQKNGQPLPGGTITFFSENTRNNPVSAIIKEDGSYSCDAVPIGKCTVAIDNRQAGKASMTIGAGGMNFDAMKSAGGNDSQAKMAKMGKSAPMASKAMMPKDAGDKIKSLAAKEGAKSVDPTVNVPGKVVPIDSKYFDASKSGLTIDVSGGEQDFSPKLD